MWEHLFLFFGDKSIFREYLVACDKKCLKIGLVILNQRKICLYMIPTRFHRQEQVNFSNLRQCYGVFSRCLR